MSTYRSADVKIQKTIGSGSERVYLYFFDNDRRLANSEGRNRWECKIGYTRRRLDKRLFEQGLATTLDRHPIVGLEILSDHAQVLETRIHRALNERKVSHGAGNEWFVTNPDEVEEIYFELLPSMEKLAAILDTFKVTDEAFEVVCSESMGNALRKIRLESATTQIEVANIAGIRQATLSSFENGSDGTRFDTLLTVLRCYGYHLLIVKAE